MTSRPVAALTAATVAAGAAAAAAVFDFVLLLLHDWLTTINFSLLCYRSVAGQDLTPGLAFDQ